MGSTCSSKPNSLNLNNKGNTKNLNVTTAFPKGKFFYNYSDSKSVNPMENKNYEGGYQKIYLFFKLINLKNLKDSFKIDFFICNDKKVGDYISMGATEKLSGESIVFSKFYLIDFIFEREQPMRIVISSTDNPSKQTTIETTLANIMGTRNLSNKYDVCFNLGEKAMELNINAKNSKESKDILRMKLDCSFNREYFTLNNRLNYFFFILNNFADGQNYRKLYKSEEISTSITSFDELFIEKNLVCDSDTEPIKIEFYDMNFQQFAYCNSNIENIINRKGMEIFDSKTTKQIGSVSVKISVEKVKNFIDFLSEGMQINLVIGIDFTASNGSPTEYNSLHYCSSGEPNHYERAIVSCGNILSYYDYDKVFPVFGFGAQMRGSNEVLHCFNMNFDSVPNIEGVENVIATYKKNLYNLNFSGPTYFTPLIRNTLQVIKFNINNDSDLKYYILLILTDGQITDMTQTIDAIVEAAHFPISIIIIGVGNADFRNMVVLDGDENPIVNSQGIRIKRDIVQFVEFRKYEGDSNKLAAEVLREVPRQVEEYFRIKN